MDSSKDTGEREQHTEEQKQQFYNSLSEDQKKKQSYTEWVKEAYHDQYEKWVPWLEDQYLKWFGKGDNKASYATKGKNHLQLSPGLHFSFLLTFIFQIL